MLINTVLISFCVQVKKETKMSKIIDAFCQRRGTDATAFKFFFNGQRINRDHTPKMLEMEDGNQIDVMLEAVGGGQ